MKEKVEMLIDGGKFECDNCKCTSFFETKAKTPEGESIFRCSNCREFYAGVIKEKPYVNLFGEISLPPFTYIAKFSDKEYPYERGQILMDAYTNIYVVVGHKEDGKPLTTDWLGAVKDRSAKGFINDRTKILASEEIKTKEQYMSFMKECSDIYEQTVDSNKYIS